LINGKMLPLYNLVEVEEASYEDLLDVYEINKISFPNPYPISLLFYFKTYYPKTFLVARVLNKVVGYVIATTRAREGEIISIAVLPSWRRRGIGSKLLKSLFRVLINYDINKVYLHVRVSNKDAVKFYVKNGFKIISYVPNYYSNGEGAYLMVRKI